MWREERLVEHHTISYLISQYGYWLIVLGAFIEGETFLIAAGIAAKHGLLDVPILILLSCIASTVHDCLCFFFGRYAGGWLLRRRPNWRTKIERTYLIFGRYGPWTVIFMRYLYGLRVIIPVSLGTTSISTQKFVIYDIIGGLLWSVTFIVGGYLFGETLDLLLHQLVKYHGWLVSMLIGFVILCIVGVVLWLWWRKKRSVS